MIDEGPEGRLRVGPHEPGEPGDVWSDQRIRQEDIPRPGRGEHLGLGDRGALVLADAQPFREPDDLGHLVRLDVRPEPVGAARHLKHRFEVAPDQRPEDQERGTEQRFGVVQRVARVHERGLLGRGGGRGWMEDPA